MLKFVIFVLSLFLTIKCIWGQDCTSAAMRKFDSNIARLITVGTGRRFPENKGQEMKKFCDENSDYINEIDNYKSKCLTDAAKQSSSVLLYAVKNVIKQNCKKQSQQVNKLITAATCANLGNSEINKCYTKLIDSFLGIQNERDDKKKIPMLCCEYFNLFPCMERRLQTISKCDENKINTIMDFVKGIVGNLVDIMCTDYTDVSDKCSKLGSPPKKKRSQRRSKSFVIPMVDILKSFPEF